MCCENSSSSINNRSPLIFFTPWQQWCIWVSIGQSDEEECHQQHNGNNIVCHVAPDHWAIIHVARDEASKDCCDDTWCAAHGNKSESHHEGTQPRGHFIERKFLKNR